MALPTTACSIPTPPPPGGGPREKERQEDRCPEPGPKSLPWQNLDPANPFPQWMDPPLLDWGAFKTPILPQALGCSLPIMHSCTHTHMHTRTRLHTHTHFPPANVSSHPTTQKKPLLSSLLQAPSSLSLQRHCHTWAGLSLCDPIMSLLPGWGLALQLPTFTSDLHRPPLSPPNGLFRARHLSHPRWVSAFPPDTH